MTLHYIDKDVKTLNGPSVSETLSMKLTAGMNFNLSLSQRNKLSLNIKKNITCYFIDRRLKM